MLSLQDVCRHNIRRIIRNNICLEYPNIKRCLRKQRPPRPKTTGERKARLVNLVPMQMGMMILDNFDNSNDDIDDDEDDDDDDDDEEDDDGDRLSNDGSGPLKEDSDDEDNGVHDNDDVGSTQSEEEGEVKREAAGNSSTARVHPKDKLGQNVKRKPRQDYIKEEPEIEDAAEAISDESGAVDNWADSDPNPSTPSSSSTNINADNKRSSPSSLCQEAEGDNASKRMRCVDTRDEEEGEKEDDNPRAEDGNGLNSSPIQIEQRSQRPRRELSSEDSDMENMELEPAGAVGAIFQAPATPTSVLNALHLLSIPRKFRCSSSTSADTSETSGFGSFGEEPLDLPGMGGDRDSPPSSVEGEEGVGGMVVGLEEGLASLAHKIVIAKTSSKGESSGESSGGASTERYEGPTLAQLMKERMKALPLPQALRSYLAYYRN